MRRHPYPIKAAIAGQGLRQKDVAADVGVSPQVLWMVANRRASAWPALRRRLSERLGLPESDLFEEAGHGAA